jgi:hypothetical protein
MTERRQGERSAPPLRPDPDIVGQSEGDRRSINRYREGAKAITKKSESSQKVENKARGKK